MNVLTSVSLAAAFIAGVAALLAPCCITVLLPSYFGAVFKERYKVFFMTFIFFLGVLTIFLPIGLGAAALAQFFKDYHNVIFTIGGVFLILLGMMLLLGKNLTLPFKLQPQLKKYSIPSIYILGIFSAVATTCCAPVLAGVLALSAASGSLWWGALYTLSYVLGMVAPLFLISVFLDKINFTKKIIKLRKPLTVKFKSWRWQFVLTDIIAGTLYLVMGSYILYLAFTEQLYTHAGYQLSVNLWMAKAVELYNSVFGFIPEYLAASFMIILFIALIIIFIKQYLHEED